MSNEEASKMSDPTTTDRRFFAALIAGDVKTLEDIVTDDFLIIDVFSGSEAGKKELLGGIAAGVLKFTSIEPESARVRRYGTAAVVTGSTRMRGTFGENAFQVHSRYTHVFVGGDNGVGWRLASAQGTPIT
jgi:ketosteroid isomerase-like protein